MRHRSKRASRSPRRPWFSPRELAPQSIPFALIVRCLVALVARRRTTALWPGLLATDPSLTSRPLRASAAALATFSASVWSAPGLRYASTVSVIWTTGSRAVGAVAAPGSSSRAARATDPRARPESSRGRQGRPPRAEGSIGHTRTGCVGARARGAGRWLSEQRAGQPAPEGSSSPEGSPPSPWSRSPAGGGSSRRSLASRSRLGSIRSPAWPVSRSPASPSASRTRSRSSSVVWSRSITSSIRA